MVSDGVRRWPFPGDSPVVRARKVAGAYREALAKADPDACAAVDRQMQRWGQEWVAPRVRRYDPGDRLTEAQACELACVSVGTVGTWRRRGRIDAEQGTDGTWTYRAEDVMALSSYPRLRGGRNDG